MINMSKYWDSRNDDYSDRPQILFQEEHLGYLMSCEKIIDLGCGTGQLVKKLNDKGIETWGLTYNQKEVDNKLHKNVEIGNMQWILYDDDYFDGFVMWDSLEHCESAFIALCEAERILKNKGRGLIFMPGQNWLDCHCHICCYTVPQMLHLFKQAKLRLVNVYEKTYEDKNIYCEGMAIYEVMKDMSYIPKFAR
jgi:ubiquinone/menaquinone biosynthesis C-methylase UbiE